MWDISTFSLYDRYCMINIDAGPCSRGRAQKQALPQNTWMKVFHFNVLTSCPKDELHQWFIGLCSERIIPAIMHSCTQGITQGQPCLWDQRLAAGCETLASPSLEWVAFRSPRPNGFAISPGLKRPGALGRQKCPEAANWRGRVKLKKDIWHAYTWHIPIIYDCSVSHAFQGIVWCPSHRNAYVHIGSDSQWKFRYYFFSKNTIDWKK